MKGSIYLDSLNEVAEFLKSFTGSTATFEVTKFRDGWKIEFLGGF